MKLIETGIKSINKKIKEQIISSIDSYDIDNEGLVYYIQIAFSYIMNEESTFDYTEEASEKASYQFQKLWNKGPHLPYPIDKITTINLTDFGVFNIETTVELTEDEQNTIMSYIQDECSRFDDVEFEVYEVSNQTSHYSPLQSQYYPDEEYEGILYAIIDVESFEWAE